MPDLCLCGTCVRPRDEGVYLALLRRREIIHLDSKYMIRMSESRGLFGAGLGAPGAATSRSNPSRGGGKRRARRSAASSTRRAGAPDVDRIAAHTHCSLLRCAGADNHEPATCPRHQRQQCAAGTCGTSDPAPSPARRWWAETARYLSRLRRSLVRQKLLSARPNILNKLLPDGDDVEQQLSNIDEILRHATDTRNPPSSNATTAPAATSNIPPFPRLRLTRPPPKQDRIPFPIYNCSVELPKTTYHS